MTRCDICNKVLDNRELEMNARNNSSKRWGYLCRPCRQVVSEVVYEQKREEQDEDDIEYRTGTCPMDR